MMDWFKTKRKWKAHIKGRRKHKMERK